MDFDERAMDDDIQMSGMPPQQQKSLFPVFGQKQQQQQQPLFTATMNNGNGTFGGVSPTRGDMAKQQQQQQLLPATMHGSFGGVSPAPGDIATQQMQMQQQQQQLLPAAMYGSFGGVSPTPGDIATQQQLQEQQMQMEVQQQQQQMFGAGTAAGAHPQTQRPINPFAATQPSTVPQHPQGSHFIPLEGQRWIGGYSVTIDNPDSPYHGSAMDRRVKIIINSPGSPYHDTEATMFRTNSSQHLTRYFDGTEELCDDSDYTISKPRPFISKEEKPDGDVDDLEALMKRSSLK